MQSRKGSAASAVLIRALARHELQVVGRSARDAEHAVRAKLHQLGGAFRTAKFSAPSALAAIESAPADSLETVALALMEQHLSTRERMPIVEPFYRELFAGLPAVNSVLDIGCGLNPLAAPWMPIPNRCRYICCDIYADLLDVCSAFLRRCSRLPETMQLDLLSELPDQRVDLVLALKLLPLLETAKRGTATAILEHFSSRARFIAISVPLRSIGGHGKGMRENYFNFLSALIDGRGWKTATHEFHNELLMVIHS